MTYALAARAEDDEEYSVFLHDSEGKLEEAVMGERVSINYVVVVFLLVLL